MPSLFILTSFGSVPCLCLLAFFSMSLRYGLFGVRQASSYSQPFFLWMLTYNKLANLNYALLFMFVSSVVISLSSSSFVACSFENRESGLATISRNYAQNISRKRTLDFLVLSSDATI